MAIKLWSWIPKNTQQNT